MRKSFSDSFLHLKTLLRAILQKKHQFLKISSVSLKKKHFENSKFQARGGARPEQVGDENLKLVQLGFHHRCETSGVPRRGVWGVLGANSVSWVDRTSAGQASDRISAKFRSAYKTDFVRDLEPRFKI